MDDAPAVPEEDVAGNQAGDPHEPGLPWPQLEPHAHHRAQQDDREEGRRGQVQPLRPRQGCLFCRIFDLAWIANGVAERAQGVFEAGRARLVRMEPDQRLLTGDRDVHFIDATLAAHCLFDRTGAERTTDATDLEL